MKYDRWFSHSFRFVAGFCFSVVLTLTLYPRLVASETIEPEGKALFKKHCSGCHPNPTRLRHVDNIIDRIRNPISSMPRFDSEKLSNPDAARIQIYIHRDKKAI